MWIATGTLILFIFCLYDICLNNGSAFFYLSQFGDALTNIVVVQFADNVQTGRDKRFNLTCLFRHPGEAVVTSSFIGAGYDLMPSYI